MKPRRKRGDGGVYLRGRIWWVTYSNNGEKVCESSGSDQEAEARKLLKRRMGELVTGYFIGPDAERVTVGELADDALLPDKFIRPGSGIFQRRKNRSFLSRSASCPLFSVDDVTVLLPGFAESETSRGRSPRWTVTVTRFVLGE